MDLDEVMKTIVRRLGWYHRLTLWQHLTGILTRMLMVIEYRIRFHAGLIFDPEILLISGKFIYPLVQGRDY